MNIYKHQVIYSYSLFHRTISIKKTFTKFLKTEHVQYFPVFLCKS